MLKSITLKNFKAHKDTTIEAQRINVFIGPNNSGKSSIFQALLALRQAVARGNEFFCRHQRDLTLRPASLTCFPKGKASISVALIPLSEIGPPGLTISASGSPAHDYPHEIGEPIEVSFDVHIFDNKIGPHSGKFRIEENEASWQSTGGQGSAHVVIGGLNHVINPVGSFQLLTFGGIEGVAMGSPNTSGFAGAIGMYLTKAPRNLLDSIRMIYPLRGFEEWGYPLPDNPPDALEKLALPDRAVAVASLLQYDRELEDKLSARLEDLLNVGVRAKLLPGRRVTIWAKRKEATSETLFTNEGTGTNQLPFMLVPIALAKPNETIFLSEPEAHLHPAAQSRLAGLLLKMATEGHLQLFIETHSEHILHKLLHAVAKGDLTKDDLAIYYFENLDGTSHVTRLSVDETGRVEGGLRGFFEQSVEELSDYLDALRKPQTREA